MRKLFLFSLLLIFQNSYLFSQNSSLQISGFGGPFTQISMNSNHLQTIGGGGGVILNSKFYLGGLGEGLINNPVKELKSYSDYEFSFGHGGIWLGYCQKIGAKNSLFLNAQLGWGGAILIKNEGISYIDDYLILRPGLEYERLMTKFLKIGFGVSYAIFNGIDNPVYTDKDMNALNVSIGFKFGWFD